MQTRILTVAMVVIAISAAVGMSAFTSGNVERSANVNVVNDDVGLIGLEDGNSGELVTQDGTTGELTIDFTSGSANGVNPSAHFELGDPANGNETMAFNITNNAAQSVDLTMDYTLTNTESDGDANIRFQVYDGTGTQVANVTEHSGAQNINGVASGTTHYVVIVVDTNGLTSSDDLSGTLKVSA